MSILDVYGQVWRRCAADAHIHVELDILIVELSYVGHEVPVVVLPPVPTDGNAFVVARNWPRVGFATGALLCESCAPTEVGSNSILATNTNA